MIDEKKKQVQSFSKEQRRCHTGLQVALTSRDKLQCTDKDGEEEAGKHDVNNAEFRLRPKADFSFSPSGKRIIFSRASSLMFNNRSCSNVK